MESSLGIDTSESGEDILSELDLVIEAEVEDERIASGIGVTDWGDEPGPTYEDILSARGDEKPPVHQGIAPDLVDVDVECSKCGETMCVAVSDGVIPIPICQMCRQEQQA